MLSNDPAPTKTGALYLALIYIRPGQGDAGGPGRSAARPRDGRPGPAPRGDRREGARGTGRRRAAGALLQAGL